MRIAQIKSQTFLVIEWHTLPTYNLSKTKWGSIAAAVFSSFYLGVMCNKQSRFHSRILHITPFRFLFLLVMIRFSFKNCAGAIELFGED